MDTWEEMRAIVQTTMKEKGIKQKFLAEKCGYSEKTFSLIIHGKKSISDTDIKKFCTGMGVSPSVFFVKWKCSKN